MPLPPPKPKLVKKPTRGMPKLKGEDLYAVQLNTMKKKKREKLFFPDINKGKRDRITCFYWAAMQGDMKAIRKLAKKNNPPDINWINSANGMTAAHIAAWNRHSNAIKWLRKHGANFGIKDKKGRTVDQIIEKCKGSNDLRRRIKEKRKRDAKEAKKKEQQRMIDEAKQQAQRIAAERAAKARQDFLESGNKDMFVR